MPDALSLSAALNSPKSRKAARCLALTAVLVLCARMLLSILLHPLRIGWDPALHLMCATLICQGKIPYIDMFDVNPPLIWYLNTIPASMANIFNAPLPVSFNLFLLFLMMCSGLLSVYVIFKKLPARDFFVNIGAVVGLLSFNFFLTVDFGQREEVFVLLFMPFFFLRMARWQGYVISRREALLFGLVGALGIAMKHYFVLNFLCTEIVFLLGAQAKTIKARLMPLIALENLTVATFGLLYLGHFCLLPAEARHNYFDFLVPAFSKGYAFWDTSVPACIAMPFKRNVFFLLAGSGALALALLRIYPALAALISFSLAGLVVYLLQFKGWAYQDIPVLAGGFMLTGALLGALCTLIMQRLKYKKNAFAAVAYGLSVVIAGICLVSASDESSLVSALPKFDMKELGYKGFAPMMDVDTPYTKLILENSKPNEPILFISNAVSPGFPIILQLRRTVASRHLHVCILSVLQYIRATCVRDDLTKYLLSCEPQVVHQIGEDIVHNQPSLVFMMEDPVRDDYFLLYNFIDKYMRNYTVIDTINGFAVYKRNSSDPGKAAQGAVHAR